MYNRRSGVVMYILVTQENVRKYQLKRDLTDNEIQLLGKGDLTFSSLSDILEAPEEIHEEDIYASIYSEDGEQINAIAV